MKLYADQNLQEPIDGSFTFGIVDVGDSIQKTIWLKNEEKTDDPKKSTGLLVDLKFEVICMDPITDAVITDEKIDILEAPKRMEAYDIKPIRLEWTPAIDLEQGLKAKLLIKAKKIVG